MKIKPAGSKVAYTKSMAIKKMERLKVDITEVKPNSSSKWIDYLSIGSLMIIGLCLLPLLIVLWGIGLVYNLFFPNNKTKIENTWKALRTEADLELNYRWADVDELPEFIYHYFDPNPMMIFEVNPKLDFFEGYFTNFKVERDDGLFIQKVILNQREDKIQSLPLYFFNYQTREVEKIKDLKGYELYTKGKPNDFIISAFGNEDEIEIRLRKE